MYSWSLYNKPSFWGSKRAVSHEQFIDLATQFKRVSENVFKVPCVTTIDVLRAPKVYTTFYDEMAFDGCRIINDGNRVLKTDRISAITDKVWEQAGYIDIDVRPAAEQEGLLRSAFANAEFLGTLPDHATYRIQPEEVCEFIHDVIGTMNPKMNRGDSYISNGSGSLRKPSYA
jgi:hypothetical protein